MRLAILSDLHANWEAVRAFQDTYDELWILGDLVNYGPKPSEVVDWVEQKAHCVVRGNHDHSVGFAVDPRCTEQYRAMAAETGRHSSVTLTKEQKLFLYKLPMSAERLLGGVRFYLCHARPSDPLFGYLDAAANEWAAEALLARADVLLVGHTHTPFVRSVGRTTICNPGSIGQPKTGNARACYAVWEDGEMELKSYSYDVNQTGKELADLELSNPVRDQLITILKTGGKMPRKED